MGVKQVFAGCALADAHGAGDLCVAQARFEVQAQLLSYRAHRDPTSACEAEKIGQHAHRQERYAAIVNAQGRTSSTINSKQRPRSPETPSTIG
jgi:hypothetical protein